MNKSTSLYLDLVRFIAAFAVFADHGCGQIISGGFLWQFAAYGPEAVAVFFVLSGFVIAYVVDKKEKSFQVYAVARAARIYSVAIPALILTASLDGVGQFINTSLYTAAFHYHDNGQFWRFAASTFFVNELWTLNLSPGSNWSYWSLGYEVWYYIMFSAAAFLRGRTRIFSLVLLIIAAGPGICVMLPLWLLGVSAYWLCRKNPIGPGLGALLFVGSLLGWAAYEAIAWHSGRWAVTNPCLSFLKRPELPQDVLVAIAFAGSLVGFNALSKALERHVHGSWSPLRWTAGATFSLYLFHEPLLRFFATVNPYAPTSWAGRALVLGGTLICVFIAAEFTERRKEAWRRPFEYLFVARSRLSSRYL